ncbi:hypothetical protein H5410_013873 [Solanum commersonii]|uniref:Uncharacterized protein n=1 Tax=Solanum commersonii TaxID=4109 RepID=A0A9J5ZPF1_SOLCO|nr:hypothetical protein H5410_013873 [Solanum commersonii]
MIITGLKEEASAANMDQHCHLTYHRTKRFQFVSSHSLPDISEISAILTFRVFSSFSSCSTVQHVAEAFTMLFFNIPVCDISPQIHKRN